MTALSAARAAGASRVALRRGLQIGSTVAVLTFGAAFAGPTAFARDGAVFLVARDLDRVPIGAWATYKAAMTGLDAAGMTVRWKLTGRKSNEVTFDMTISGPGPGATGMNTTFVVDAKAKGGRYAVKRRFMRQGGKVMELPATSANPAESFLAVAAASLAGGPPTSVTVPAGKFSTSRYTYDVPDGTKYEFWTDSPAGPLGIVRMRAARNRPISSPTPPPSLEMELIASGVESARKAN